MTANDESRTSISPSASDSARPDVVSGALSPRNNRWRRGAPWALGGLFSLGLLVAWSTSLEKPAAASVPLDVPHVEGDAIVFSDAYAQRIHLERAAVRKAPLTPVVWVVGTVALDPTHMAAVGTRLRGLVRTVRKFEGDVIAKGELLAEVERDRKSVV